MRNIGVQAQAYVCTIWCSYCQAPSHEATAGSSSAARLPQTLRLGKPMVSASSRNDSNSTETRADSPEESALSGEKDSKRQEAADGASEASSALQGRLASELLSGRTFAPDAPRASDKLGRRAVVHLQDLIGAGTADHDAAADRTNYRRRLTQRVLATDEQENAQFLERFAAILERFVTCLAIVSIDKCTRNPWPCLSYVSNTSSRVRIDQI